MKISTLGTLECSLAPQVADRFNSHKDDFQMTHADAARALELVRDPSCDLKQVAQAIEKDVKLSASILAVANSVMYSPGRPIRAVREAIVHVGLHHCQNLIQACCAKGMMQQLDVDRKIRSELITHSLATAAFASALNQTLNLGLNGEEFAAGILHDVGRLLLAAMYPNDSVALHSAQAPSTAASLADEEEIVGTDHTVVGCYFAITNRLPDDLAEAIRYHHTPELADIAPRLTSTIAVAVHLASQWESDGTDIDADSPHLQTFEQVFGTDVRAALDALHRPIVECAEAAFSSFTSV